MNNKRLTVTIVTVCLNSERTIRDTLESVRQQTYSEIEHVIIDGVSTDNTLKIVGEFDDIVSCVVSEKDKGIYDAMNKGVSIATGDIIYFLNSDDSLCDPDVLTHVVSKFQSNPELELIYGNAIVVTREGNSRSKFNWLNKRNLIYSYLCHQVVFARKSVFNRVGGFDLEYKIASDFDWLLKVFKTGTNICYIDRDIVYFWGEGLHMSDRTYSDNERTKVKLKYQKHTIYIVGELVFRIMRKIRKIIYPNNEE